MLNAIKRQQFMYANTKHKLIGIPIIAVMLVLICLMGLVGITIKILGFFLNEIPYVRKLRARKKDS